MGVCCYEAAVVAGRWYRREWRGRRSQQVVGWKDKKRTEAQEVDDGGPEPVTETLC